MIGAVTIASCGGSQPAQETPEATPARQAVAPPAEAPHWDYGQEHGPAAWGRLSPDFVDCAEGTQQSPIDFDEATTSTVPELRTRYGPAALRIVHHEHQADVVNTGHSIQVNLPGADTLEVGGESYALVQYHFHSPSEHTVKGQHYPMEMHLVHKSAAGKLAVVGVFLAEGAHNVAFDPVWANLPKEKSVETHLEHVQVDIDDLLPAERSTYRYDGSLTTPPCSEGVKWMVFTTPAQLSAEQIAAFREILNGNNRPIQPLHQRSVSVSPMAATAAQ
jgi:carbonic anhydrase